MTHVELNRFSLYLRERASEISCLSCCRLLRIEGKQEKWLWQRKAIWTSKLEEVFMTLLSHEIYSIAL